MRAPLRGYNGWSPGHRGVEGDNVRTVVTNKVPEPMTVQWRGMLVPHGMVWVEHLLPGNTPPTMIGSVRDN